MESDLHQVQQSISLQYFSSIKNAHTPLLPSSSCPAHNTPSTKSLRKAQCDPKSMWH